MRKNQQELIGRRFGRLVVQSEAGAKNEKRMVLVLCDCSASRNVRANSLLTGNTTSCGCSNLQPQSHGHAAKKNTTRTYRIWANMRARGAGQIAPKNYSERGITVCERWSSFENFLADMGEAPDGYSIERGDNDGNYEPENCHWATTAEQARNRRNNVKLTHDGQTKCITDWAADLGVHIGKIRRRHYAGQSMTQIVGELS